MDISPLCVLIAKVKTQSIKVIDKIKRYKEFYIDKEKITEPEDERVRNFYKVAEMMAHSDSARRKKNFDTSFVNDMIKMTASVEDYKNAAQKYQLKLGKTEVLLQDSRKIALANDSIDGIITSPPYSIALNYVANDAHSLTALGYHLEEIKENFIGVRGSGMKKFELYDDDMEKVYSEMYRVLKFKKFCVIVIGNVHFQGEEIDTAQKVVHYCEKIGFKTIKKNRKDYLWSL